MNNVTDLFLFLAIWLGFVFAALCALLGPWRFVGMVLSVPPIRRLIIAYAARHPYDHIHGKDGSLYMGRWWLLQERSWFPWAIRLHHIAREDRDRHYHDHPYAYRTIILQGGYLEDCKEGGFRWWARGNSVARAASHYHRILRVEPNTYTIFIYRYRATGHNEWGFLVDGVKVPWHQYLAQK